MLQVCCFLHMTLLSFSWFRRFIFAILMSDHRRIRRVPSSSEFASDGVIRFSGVVHEWSRESCKQQKFWTKIKFCTPDAGGGSLRLVERPVLKEHGQASAQRARHHARVVLPFILSFYHGM